MLLHKLFTFLFILSLIGFLSCNTTEPPPPNNGTLSISLTDASCTEAWLELKTSSVAFPVNINILADGSTIAQLNNLNSNDTTVYIDSLLPNKNYQLQAQFVKDNQTTSSNKLSVQTLDTTSSNFTWQTYTFGEGASSILYDVAIIDANNIWAVGEIYMNDSTGQPDPLAYNLVQWNGAEWKLSRLQFPQYNYYSTGCTVAFNSPGAINSVFAFNENNILFTDGLSVARWNGSSFINYTCVDISIIGNGRFKRIWGNSENDFYCVGTNGTIFHYANNTWQKIESGISIGFLDIWGDTNPFTGENEIYCSAFDQIPTLEYGLLRINQDNTTTAIKETGLGPASAIWFKAGVKYYAVGNSIYEKDFDKSSWINLNSGGSITNYPLASIRGTGLNDIYASGAYGEIVHFNGRTWKSFHDQTSLNNNVFSYFRLAAKDNIVVAVGADLSNGAVIAVGHRQ
jgi:hypothetical protein